MTMSSTDGKVPLAKFEDELAKSPSVSSASTMFSSETARCLMEWEAGTDQPIVADFFANFKTSSDLHGGKQTDEKWNRTTSSRLRLLVYSQKSFHLEVYYEPRCPFVCYGYEKRNSLNDSVFTTHRQETITSSNESNVALIPEEREVPTETH